MQAKKRTVRGEGRLGRWRRRAISVPLVSLAFFAMVAMSPVWIPLAWLYDRVHGSGSALLRCGALLTIYLGCEVVGIVSSLVLWVRDLVSDSTPASVDRSFQSHFRLQSWWSGTLMAWARRLFRMRFEVEGLDSLDRPMILMLTHSSIADTLLATEFISLPHGIHLRYLLKRELLFDPCLDIVGHRLPNYFVDRDSNDPEDVRSDVAALLSGLREDEGALIYPEGTRFTKGKRDRAIARFDSDGDPGMASLARSLRHTLPPRLGGALAMLDANPGLDVVFCAHSGFEVVRRPADLLGGALVDRLIHVSFRRVPFDEIPVESKARVDWLYAEWRKSDAWIASQRRSGIGLSQESAR